MDETMRKFFENAKRLGLCEQYTSKWGSAKSKKQLIDLALDANGLSYVATAITKSYGLTAEYISNSFSPFINGKYIREKDGYTSALYCFCADKRDLAEIVASTTAVLVIGFKGTIRIPKNRICELHLVNCTCHVEGEGRCDAYIYGSTNILNEKEAPIKVMNNE